MAERRTRKTEAARATSTRSSDRLPLNALRVFEAVAAQCSFAAAADALHVTPAAVSMQVRTLEDYLQAPLFQRNGREVTLTEEGAALLPGVRRGLAELQQAMQQLRQSRHAGLLRISTLASFMHKWLLQRLPDFRDQHPDLDLQVHTSNEAVVFTEGGFHGALRLAAGPTPGLYNEKLLDEWFVPVCSPALLARHGPVRSATDLHRYPLLRSTDESWALWDDLGQERTWQESGTAFDQALTLQAAAEQGQGLALTRWTIAAQDIADGRIVRASERAIRHPRAYYFVCPESYLPLPKVQRLLAWLRAQSAAFAGPEAAPEKPVAVAPRAAGKAARQKPAAPLRARRRPASRGRGGK